MTTGLNLEGVTLSEISLTEKDKYVYVESKKAELGEIVGRWLPGAGEVGKWGRYWSQGTNLQLENE